LHHVTFTRKQRASTRPAYDEAQGRSIRSLYHTRHALPAGLASYTSAGPIPSIPAMSGQYTDHPDRPSTVVFPHQTAQAICFGIFIVGSSSLPREHTSAHPLFWRVV
jgi:hypothetical protein